jgi:hypothetical protein
MNHPNHLAQIPDPAGAVHIDKWRADDNGEGFFRYFAGSSWVVERTEQHADAAVVIGGLQHADGTVSRSIWCGAAQLTTSEARQLARALIAAADEAERFNDNDRPQS